MLSLPNTPQNQAPEPQRHEQRLRTKVKRPPNAYLLFCQDMGKTIGGTFDAVEKTKILSSMWAKLPLEEKQVFHDRAHELNQKFKAENPSYRYKQRPVKRRVQSTIDNNEMDSLQILDHMFQNNPLLFQQMLSEKEEQGKPNVYRLFYSEE